MNLAKSILHLEGVAVFAGALVFYFGHLEASWMLLVLLLLVPDLSMAGFLRDTRLGALTYNLVHNYVLGLGVTGLGLALGADVVAAVGAILVAHVAMDRMLGYGLKFPTHFKDTHLQRLGTTSEARGA
jgi:hypothetical protein